MKVKGPTITYQVTLSERDAMTLLTMLDNASEHGAIADPFDVQRIEGDRIALTVAQREDMIQRALRNGLNEHSEYDLKDMDDYELRQHMHQLEH